MKILLEEGTLVKLYHEDDVTGKIRELTMVRSIKDIEFDERELVFMSDNINVYMYREPHPIFSTNLNSETVTEIRWKDPIYTN